MEDKDEKGVSDMYLAAALHAYGATLRSIDRSNLRRQNFIFCGPVKRIYIINNGAVEPVENPSLNDVEMAYISERLMFPQRYPSSVKTIKLAIHANPE